MKNFLKEKILKWPVLEEQYLSPTCQVVYDGKFQIKIGGYGDQIYISKHNKSGKWIKWLSWTISLILISISSYAQLKIEPGRITLHADTMEVRQAFALLHYMIPKSQKIEKVVIKDGNEYRQTRWLINRMLKRYAYVNGGRLRRI